MDYLKIDLYTKSEGIYPLTAMLQDIGIEGFDIHDSNDFFDFLQNSKGNWDYIDDSLNELKTAPTFITFYLPNDEQGKLQLEYTNNLISRISSDENTFGSLETKMSLVKDEDWENNWKKYYKPFNVGEKLIVKPSWENIEDNDRLILEIDPASTFGTGQHPTTKMCMELLEKLIKQDDKVLDLGTGSAILSIASLLLGAGHTTVVDITQNAVKTAGENIKRNNFDEQFFTAYCGDICTDNELVQKIGGGFDLIVANIVADVIIAMSGLFGNFLKEDGVIIVSGIINPRVDEVKQAMLKNGFEVSLHCEENEWNAITFKRIK